MLRHLMVDGIEFLIIPVIVMDHSCLGIIRNQDTGNTAEVLIHMYMSCDPGTLFLIDKGFNVRVLAVRHNAYKAKGRGFDSRHEQHKTGGRLKIYFPFIFYNIQFDSNILRIFNAKSART